MIRILLIALCVIPSMLLQAQKSDEYIMVRYDSGEFFNGRMISDQDDLIQLEIVTGDTIEINRLHRLKVYDKDNAIVYPDGQYYETEGKFWTFSFGMNAGNFADSVDQRISSHLEILWAKRMGRKFNVGLGFGFEFNEASVSGFVFNTQFTSLTAYGRYYLTSSNRQRFFSFAKAGYGFAAEEQQEGFTNEHNGGYQATFGLGCHFSSRKRSKFQLMLGYYLQKTDGREFFLDNLGNEVETNFDILIRRLMFKFGWEFG